MGFPAWGRRTYRAYVEKSNNATVARGVGGFAHVGEVRPLTVSRGLGYLFKLDFKRTNTMDWATRHDADIQASEPQADQQARVPCTHEDPWRSEGAEPAPPAGSRSSRGEDRQQVDARSPDRGERLPRSARIRHSTEIRALLQRGKRKRTPNVDVFFTPSPASRSRLGVVVPKHGRNIVERNRLKRRLREIGRRGVLPRLDEQGRAGDVLIRARGKAYEAQFEELLGEVITAVEGFWSDES